MKKEHKIQYQVKFEFRIVVFRYSVFIMRNNKIINLFVIKFQSSNKF